MSQSEPKRAQMAQLANSGQTEAWSFSSCLPSSVAEATISLQAAFLPSCIAFYSLKVASHGAVQKLGDGHIVVLMLKELDHEHVVVLVDRHVVVLRQELGHGDVSVHLLQEGGHGGVVKQEAGQGRLQELCHCDVV